MGWSRHCQGRWQEGRGDAPSSIPGEVVAMVLSRTWVLPEMSQGWPCLGSPVSPSPAEPREAGAMWYFPPPRAKPAALLLHPQPCCPRQALGPQQLALWLAGTIVPPRDSCPSVSGHPGGTLPEGARTAARLKAARSRAGAVARAPGHGAVKSRVYAPSQTSPLPYKPLLGDFSQTRTWVRGRVITPPGAGPGHSSHVAPCKPGPGQAASLGNISPCLAELGCLMM